MGRLLRKKPTGAKKQKKTVGDGSDAQTENKVAVKPQAGASAAASKDAGRRPSPSSPKPPSVAARSASRTLNIGFVNKSVQFLREVKMELKKVTWPTRKQAIGSTVVVVLLVMIISLFLGVVDIGWSNLFHVIMH